MRRLSHRSAPRTVLSPAQYELVDSLPVLAGLANTKLRQTLVKPRQQDARLQQSAMSYVCSR